MPSLQATFFLRRELQRCENILTWGQGPKKCADISNFNFFTHSRGMGLLFKSLMLKCI